MFNIGSKNYNLTISDENSFQVFQKHAEINNLHSFINEQPVYPEWRENIQKMEFIRAIQGTIALEGSELEVDDVQRIANQEKPSDSDKDREAENALLAYEFIQEWSANNPDGEITESVIKQLHTIMTRGISYYLNEPGIYRNQPVEFGYPKQKSVLMNRFDVEDAMARVVVLINQKASTSFNYSSFPITKAIISHYFMTFIHPFIDGNGRVSRAVEALILHHYGNFEPYFFPVSASFYYKERKKYFELLRNVDDTGEPFPFISFAIDGLYQNLSEIKKHLLDQITRTLILDYAHQLRRQKKILKRQTTLLENMFYLKPMELSEFWRKPGIRAIYLKLSDSTRKRDLAKLDEYKFVKFSKASSSQERKRSFVEINWDVLRMVTIRLDKIPHRP